MNAASMLVAVAVAASEAGPWVVALEEGGVRVEEREGASPSRSFRAEARVRATPEACLAVVASDAFFARTAPHVAEARVVGTEGAHLRWFYARFDPPFVAPRDYTLRVEASERPSPEGRELRLSWRIDNGRGPPPRPGTIRVERSDGAWTFTPAVGGQGTLARYELSADPGGAIPGWLARRAQIAGILAAYDELRRAAGGSEPRKE